MNANSADENNDTSQYLKNNNSKKSTGARLQTATNEAEGNVPGTGDRRQSQTSTISAIFQYNLIVALAVRGELEKADEMVDGLWKKNGK